MPTPQIYAFVGSDDGRVKEAAMKAVKKLSAGSDPEFGTDIVDGQADNAEEAERSIHETIQAIQTIPFFGGSKVVWLKAANFFGETRTAQAQDTLAAGEKLLELLEKGLSDEVTFVLSTTAMDKRRSFWKRLQKVAKVESFDRADISREGWERNLVPQILKQAKQLELELTPYTAEFFVAMVGNDSRRLTSELEKLRAYAGSHASVDEDDIRAVVSKSRGGIVFEIGNAIGARDLPRALASLEHFLSLGEQPIGILRAGVVHKVRTLLAARELISSNRLRVPRRYGDFQALVNDLPAEATDHLPRNKSGQLSLYPLFLAAGECRQFSMEELVTAVEECLEADHTLVSSATDAPLVLSRLLYRILSPKKTAPAS